LKKNETPLDRAKIEIFEEVGIEEDQIKLIKSSNIMRISSPQYKNHEWEVYPFLFEGKDLKIKLNWENSQYKWVRMDEFKNYKKVPSLEKVLLNLL